MKTVSAETYHSSLACTCVEAIASLFENGINELELEM
jgi:hypothetical protein